jgi:hypothetical protein
VAVEMLYDDDDTQDKVVFHEVDPAFHSQLIFEQAFKPGLEVELEIVEGDSPDIREPKRFARGTGAPPIVGAPANDMLVVVLPPRAATADTRVVDALAADSHAHIDGSLDDDWFGAFDDTKPIEYIDDEPTTPWRRFSTWLRNRVA